MPFSETGNFYDPDHPRDEEDDNDFPDGEDSITPSGINPLLSGEDESGDHSEDEDETWDDHEDSDEDDDL